MSRKMHLTPDGMELCGYETSDGKACKLCDREKKEHDNKIRDETKTKVLKMLDELIFASGWESLPAKMWTNKSFQEIYTIGAKEMEEVWHDNIKEIKNQIEKEL